MTGQRLSTTVRLVAAAILSVLALGTTWSVTSGTTGMYMGGTYLASQYNYFTDRYELGPQYTPMAYYLPGSTGSLIHGSEDPMRVVLVPAAATFAVAASRRTRATRRAAQLATVGCAAATFFAVAQQARTASVVVALATLVAASTVWPVPSWRWAARRDPALGS